MPFQDFDLVSVRVLDEEKPRQQFLPNLELLDRQRTVPGRGQRRMRGRNIVNDRRHMPVPVAMRIGLLAPLVQRELKLDIVLGIAQIHQREVRKIQRVGRLEAEDFVVEAQRCVEVAHADHRVDQLGHD